MTPEERAPVAPASLPPLAPLLEIVTALERRGIPCALGGSGLLVAHGLADSARDWDLTCDAPLGDVRDATARLESTHVGPNGIHADHKLVFAGGAVELIVGFAFTIERGVVRIPCIVDGHWSLPGIEAGIPLASLEAWAVAYALMGRPAKSELLFEHLAGIARSPSAIVKLLAEPLPDQLETRLRALAT